MIREASPTLSYGAGNTLSTPWYSLPQRIVSHILTVLQFIYILPLEPEIMASTVGAKFCQVLFYASNTISKQRKEALVALAYATA
jgi:hypothetical protein